MPRRQIICTDHCRKRENTRVNGSKYLSETGTDAAPKGFVCALRGLFPVS